LISDQFPGIGYDPMVFAPRCCTRASLEDAHTLYGYVFAGCIDTAASENKKALQMQG